MKKSFITILLVIFFAFTSNIYADGGSKTDLPSATTSTITLKGKIIDKNTGEALPGAKIKIADKEVFTDFDGNFSLQNIPIGKYNFSVEYISYNTLSIPNFSVTYEDQTGMVIKLKTE